MSARAPDHQQWTAAAHPHAHAASRPCARGCAQPLALGMTPDQLVRIEIRRIAGQEVQRKQPLCVLHVLLDDGLLVRWQAVNDQMNRFVPLEHHVLQ